MSVHHTKRAAARTAWAGFRLAFLGAGLYALPACAQTPSRVRAASMLDDVARGFHPGAAGYLDFVQANTLGPGASYERPYGRLEGYVQRRRLAMLMLDPDSLAPVRGGILAAWDQGGWTGDSYLLSPGGAHEDIVVWTGGLACAVPRLETDIVAGFVHGRKVSWRSPVDDQTVEPSGTSAFALGRWKRASQLAVVDDGGLRHARVGLEPATGAILDDGFLVPQLQASFDWSQAEWNRWEKVDAWGVGLGAPLWKDRIFAKVEAGDEGFRQARVECELTSEGVVGLDLSYARTRSGRRLPGVRVRVPLLTFGWNDPEDAAAFGTESEWPVWSARLQMVWEGPEVYYRPGRRASPGGAR